MAFQSGDYIWAKTNKKYWPGIVLSATQIDKPYKEHAEWVYWFGDGRISQVRRASMVRFHRLIEEHAYDREFFYALGKRRFAGMLEALKHYKNVPIAKLNGYERIDDTEEELLRWAFEGFEGREHNVKNEIPHQVFYSLQKKSNVNDNLFIKSPKKLSALKENRALENFCLGCYHDEVYTVHPLFEGGLCIACKERYEQRFFMIGADNIHCLQYCCAICCGFGNLIVCSTLRCGLSYCFECIDNLASPSLRTYILSAPRWSCFVCSAAVYTKSSRHINRRADWRERLHAFFNTHRGYPMPRIHRRKEKLRVLSLFDGIATGLLALKQLDVEVEIYFAAELDFNAKTIALQHHEEQILYLGSGDVREVNATILQGILPIHLVLGGSPCNDLSMANPLRKGLFDKTGTGILFYEYCRIITTLKQIGNVPFFWLYENVASMPNESKNIITRFLECQPAEVNSVCVSPQQRMRYFWGNCPSLHVNLTYDGEHSLQDYLEDGRTAAVEQIRTITTNFNSLLQGAEMQHAVFDANMELTALSINEIEQVFGLPENYTQHADLSKSARLALVGRAWCVQTICMLLHFLKYFFRLRSDKR